MKKQLLLIVMLLSAAASAFAEEVEINGLRYDVNTVTKEATVIWYEDDDNKYKGNIVIPETVLYRGVTCSVTSIGDHAFQACFDLTSVTIPNSVTSIGDYAFYYCNSLTSVTIPNSVTSIGDDAFSQCSGLTSVTIGNSVTSIGSSAFRGCTGLTSVTIPNSVTSIGSGAFRDCIGLQKVIVKDIAAWCGISFSDNHSNPLSCAKHLYSDENTEITELIIPNSVTSIGDYAFYFCTGLTSVTIGNSVTSIGNYAFGDCFYLISVTIPNSVTSIGNGAFQDCDGLTSVTIPNSVTSIGYGAFVFCTGLTSVTIGNSVTSIGSRAFWDCDGLQKVIVKDIAAWCGISFSDIYSNPLLYAKHLYSDENTEITELIIPNSVTSIGDYAFCQCFDLTSVTIGNSVTSIGSNAFRGCTGLTSVTIGNSVTSIGNLAFGFCTGLTSVTCYAENVPSTKSDAFDSSNVRNATLYVPTASIDAYKTTEPWSRFKVIEGIETGIKDIKTKATSSSPIYDLHGRQVEKTTKGLYIVNGNKVMMK